MIQGTSAAGAHAGLSSGAGAAARDAALREACAQLEGVFINEMLKLMRNTVPEGGALDGGAGEEIFTGLFDQHLSGLAASGFERGIGAALYRQLQRIDDAAARSTAAEPGRVP